MRKFKPIVSYDHSLSAAEIQAIKPLENMLTTRIAAATSNCSEDNRWHAIGENSERRLTFVRYPAKTAAIFTSLTNLAEIKFDPDAVFLDLLFKKGVAAIPAVTHDILEKWFGAYVKITTSTGFLTGILLGYNERTRIKSVQILPANGQPDNKPITVSCRQILHVDQSIA